MENKRIRISNDITLKVAVNRLGQAEDLTGKNAQLLLCAGGEVWSLPYMAEGNVLTAIFWGADQHRIGSYSVKVVEIINEKSINAVDKRNVFTLVSNSENSTEGLTGPQTVEIDLDICLPTNGLSTYELAVIRGFVGTEAEWMESLKGKDGESAYQEWLAQGNKGTKADFIESLEGEAGKSAFQSWLDIGNVGTEEDFIRSLEGPKGDPGRPGENGHDGNLIYPTYRVDSQMHLRVKSDVDTDRIRINEKNHLTINIS